MLKSVDLLNQLVANRESELHPTTYDIKTRELHLANKPFFGETPRDVFKYESIKEYNNTSRDSHEDDMEEVVSKETKSVTRGCASNPLTISSSSSLSPVGGVLEENVIAPARTTTRWSGISAHHVKTKKGVKVGVTLQKPEWAPIGRVLQITAELKRYDRIREVKCNEDDSDQFAEHLRQVKTAIHESKNKNYCLGRAHQRGARKEWIQDTFVLAEFDGDMIKEVTVHIEGDSFDITMDQAMSERQKEKYHSTGYHGTMKFAKRSPKIDELPTKDYLV